ncbi:CDGSH iron-sulfur domain-containing protein [Tepidiforma sp.]|uniref:CDGSH iron-sulfur domain-containing protein n=1 Tax=Tepidiforma sp. TaxID=2682230 RepID=UPI002616E2D4|nr:CDGSH iron-sulfur domain-containing protein [Tepidiforma sp.]MCX7616447.1 CDGSH iron-sulfur domain-containing protein [Tepidiforma sp.]
MAETTITVRDHGPYVIRGEFVVVDAEGNQFERKEAVALCRCGHSATKPFCDGSHNRERFQSAPRAGG